MFFLETVCAKCGTINEIYSKPHEKMKNFTCENCRSGKLVLKKATDMTAKGFITALKHLENRVTSIEEGLKEAGFSECEIITKDTKDFQ